MGIVRRGRGAMSDLSPMSDLGAMSDLSGNVRYVRFVLVWEDLSDLSGLREKVDKETSSYEDSFPAAVCSGSCLQV